MSPRNRTITDAKGDWRVSRRLLPYLWKHRFRISVALIFLILARVANVAVPLTLKQIVDRLDVDAVLIIPLGLLIAYGLLRFSTILFNELRNVVFSKAAIEIIRNISAFVFEHLHRLSLSFHLDRKIGALSRDLDRGKIAITSFLTMIVFNIVPVIIEILMVIVILWNQLGIRYVFITMAMILVYCVFTFFVTQWRTKFRVQMNESDSSANTRVLDSLINYETVKVFGNEKKEQQRYGVALKTWAESSTRNNYSLSFLNIGQGLIIAVGLTMLMIMAANGILNEELSIGDFVMVNAFLIQLYIPLNFLGSVYRELNHSLIDMERMFDLMDIEPKVIDRPDAKTLNFDKGEITFENINFSYQENNPILRDISFTVAGGKKLAVVGPSGSGKSTLSKLLLRFYEPGSGQISIDKQDIQSLTQESLRKVMGVVPQDTVLFNETIGYNIGYGKQDASIEEIVEAAKVAQIDDFIQSHPEGYEILVGERGLKLSGGEKQRVAIARVALKGARILIFDEATSSLDSRSEKAIQEALQSVSKNNTTLIIAHRLSTIIDADEIIVLDKGTIVERGTHNDLIEQNGLYAQMWELQKEG